MIAGRVPGPDELSVGLLYRELGDLLDLRPLNDGAGFGHPVRSQDLNRPGMALTGYTRNFLHDRIQVFGETEITYLDSLGGEERRRAVERLFGMPVYCSVVTKGLEPPEELVEASLAKPSALFSSGRDTTPLMHDLSDYLERVFAPRTDVYGSLVEVYGVGTLVTGRSAIGKSETVLGLLERGHRLVADDRVYVSRLRGKLYGTGDSMMGRLMEVRGLGLVDVSSFYGIRAFKERQQIQMEVRLAEWDRSNQTYDRTGLSRMQSTVLDVSIPQTIIPVLPGRNLTLLLEIAVMSHMLLASGRNVPEEMERELIERIASKAEATASGRGRESGPLDT